MEYPFQQFTAVMAIVEIPTFAIWFPRVSEWPLLKSILCLTAGEFYC